MLGAVKIRMMKKEPLDYLMGIMLWLLVPTIALTENSKQKWIRVIGALMACPFAICWIITGIPFLLCAIALLIAQICVDA